MTAILGELLGPSQLTLVGVGLWGEWGPGVKNVKLGVGALLSHCMGGYWWCNMQVAAVACIEDKNEMELQPDVEAKRKGHKTRSKEEGIWN